MLATCKDEVGVKKVFFSLLFCGLVWENANEMNVHNKKIIYVQNNQINFDVHQNGGQWRRHM